MTHNAFIVVDTNATASPLLPSVPVSLEQGKDRVAVQEAGWVDN